MRDNKYFVSTTDQKYWFLDESQTANEDNRQLTTITRDWSGIDASFFYEYRVECEPKYRDKLFLINF
jgi:hypothetical protein